MDPSGIQCACVTFSFTRYPSSRVIRFIVYGWERNKIFSLYRKHASTFVSYLLFSSSLMIKLNRQQLLFRRKFINWNKSYFWFDFLVLGTGVETLILDSGLSNGDPVTIDVTQRDFFPTLCEVLPALALLAKFFDPVEVKFTLSRAIYSVEVDFYSVRVNLQSQFFMRFRRQKTE